MKRFVVPIAAVVVQLVVGWWYFTKIHQTPSPPMRSIGGYTILTCVIWVALDLCARKELSLLSLISVLAGSVLVFLAFYLNEPTSVPTLFLWITSVIVGVAIGGIRFFFIQRVTEITN